MTYKPSEYRYKGTGKYYYILYEHLEKTRSGKKTWKPRAKRVFVSGKLISKEIGYFINKYGRRVHGIKLIYENVRAPYNRKSFTAKRGKTKYRVSATHIPRTKVPVTKIVELPKNIRKVKITTSKRKAEPTLPNVR